MKSSTKSRIETYCRIAFKSLLANLNEWKETSDKDFKRGVTRIYYDLVHSLSIPSGFITAKALEKKKQHPRWNVCKDHCYTPQFIGRMMMDNSHIYLQDFSKFRELFYVACTTIEILSEENRDLSLLTVNNKKNFTVSVPMNERYKHLGIELVERKTGRRWYNKDTVPVSNIIQTPQEILDYEKQFLIKI